MLERPRDRTRAAGGRVRRPQFAVRRQLAVKQLLERSDLEIVAGCRLRFPDGKESR